MSNLCLTHRAEHGVVGTNEMRLDTQNAGSVGHFEDRTSPPRTSSHNS